MRGLLLIALLASAIVLSFAPSAGAQADVACSDFPSQAAAQSYFFNNGGSPKNNVKALDKDGDGWVCEHNPPPYAPGFSRSQVDEPGSTPVLPQTGTGGHLNDTFIVPPIVLVLAVLALGATLTLGGSYVRRSAQ
jgi:hypothetical protein